MRALKSGNGFTLVEFMISALVFVPLIGAIVMLFGTGVDYYGAVQRASQMNNEARNAVEIMSLEIAQAGTRRDITTTSTQDITLSVLPQNVQVASNKGFSVGDQVIVDAGALAETVQLTEVRTNSIGGLFLKSHASGTSVCFFAIPYLTGIVPPATLLPNSSVTSTVLRSYGDFYDNGVLYYVEYAYDDKTSQITKSITPLNQTTKNLPEVLLRNVSAGAGPFTLYSDSEGAVTLVQVSLTASSTWQKKPQTSSISARLAAPSVAAASSISKNNKTYGASYTLPGTPAKVVAWSAS